MKVHRRHFPSCFYIRVTKTEEGRLRADLSWQSNQVHIGHCQADTKEGLDTQIGKLIDDYHRFSQPGAIPEDYR